jgi:23S rRNA-/tRNA-specific pseudouridylate synthase
MSKILSILDTTSPLPDEKLGLLNHRKWIFLGPRMSLLAFLSRELPLSEEECHLIVRLGGAYRNKRRCKRVDQPLTEGDFIQVFYRLPLQWPEIPWDDRWIGHQDKTVVVAVKPQGLPTQGRRESDVLSFYDLLKQYLGGYLGLHHRLDQDTSGLLLFTRDPKVNPTVAALFRERAVQKTYLVLCRGGWPGSQSHLVVKESLQQIDSPFGKRHQVNHGGKMAETHLTRLAEGPRGFAAFARPITGRTHQIRLHCQHLGTPVWGDPFYGTPEDRLPQSDRLMLHALRLTWPARESLPAGDFLAKPAPLLLQRLKELGSDWESVRAALMQESLT